LVTDDGIPMFLFVGQGGEQNKHTLGLGSHPEPGAEIYSNGSPSTTTPTFGGNINYAVVKTGVRLPGNWQSQDGMGGGNPLWSTVPICGDGVRGKFPCNIMGVDRNFRNPFVTTWTLGVEHAFTTDLSLNVAYVGNHGSRLPGITDLNQPIPVPSISIPSSPNALSGQYATQFPFPWQHQLAIEPLLVQLRRLANNPDATNFSRAVLYRGLHLFTRAGWVVV